MTYASTTQGATVAVFRTHDAAEVAVKSVLRAGFDMTRLSIIGKDLRTEETITGCYTTGERMRHWGAHSLFWGGMWGLLNGSGFFFVPGIGPVLAAGPVVAAIVAGLESDVFVGGVSAIGAALVSLGIPRYSVLGYEADLKAGRYIVIAHGSEPELSHARQLIGRAVAESAVQYVA